jgi:hypothetical protein
VARRQHRFEECPRWGHPTLAESVVPSLQAGSMYREFTANETCDMVRSSQ